MLSLYLIGANTGKETEELLCLFLCRHIILLLMEYTLGNLQMNCRST